MPTIQIPNNWRPRPYQKRLWDYLEGGGRKAAVVWHRRAGKDDVALHFCAWLAMQQPATYWHMLPKYTQGRKAIWNAVNPHTGIKRRDEAFPKEIIRRSNDQEMFNEFITGATWQVVGSDNYNSLVGSPPKVVVKSEWPLANPAAQAYISPILLENNGIELSIYTPRGRNHGFATYLEASNDPTAFHEILTVDDTGVFTIEQLERARRELIALHGETFGEALFQQEYFCSFEAAIIGSYYGSEIAQARKEGRIGKVPHDPLLPIYTVWDIGWSDSTAIWFFQLVGREIRLVDYYENNTKSEDHYAKIIAEKPYIHKQSFLPHDAENGDPAKSTYTNLKKLGLNPKVLVRSPINSGIQAVRLIFSRCSFDEQKCDKGLNALINYQKEWNEEKKMFSDNPLHDWSSHGADAFRYLAMAVDQIRREENEFRPAQSTSTYDPFGRWQ